MYREALQIWCDFAKSNATVYLLYVATTLGGYGLAHLKWDDKLLKANPLLKEAGKIFFPLAKQYPTVYGDKLATTLVLYVKTLDEKATNIKELCFAMKRAAEVVQTYGAVKQIAIKINQSCEAGGIK